MSCLLAHSCALAAETNTPAIYEALSGRGREINALLIEFDASTNQATLDRALYLVDTFTSTNKASKHAEFMIRLELLSRSSLARDSNFDLKAARKGSLNVAPPILSNESTVSGMSPKDISDPVARKKYEDDIAANSLVREKFNREYTFQRVSNICAFTAKVRLKAMINAGDNERLSMAIESINKILKDEKSKGELLTLITNYSKEVEAQRTK